MIKRKDSEFLNGQMDENISETGEMASSMGKELFSAILERSEKESGTMAND